jgi:hypothetical protein
MTTEADYAYWRAALEGNFGPVHDGHAELGFWRRRYGRDEPWIPVAIYRDSLGLLWCKQGNREPEANADDVWTSACRYPVTFEAYEAAVSGKGWPDDIAPPAMGGNNPPPDEAAADEIDSAISAALAAIAKPPQSQTDADRLANHRDRLAKLYKQEDGKREAEKRPHLDANIAIEARFKPVLSKIEDAGKKVKAALTAWFNAEKAKREEEARRLAAEQEAARRKALEANQPPPAPKPVPVVEPVRAGTTGRSTGMRTFKSAIITDYKAALTHLRDHAEIKEAVQRIANAAARAGTPIPGTEIHEEQRAA